MEGLGCEVNLLRMKQRCNIVKEVNKGYGKAIIFIDSKTVMIQLQMRYYLKN